MISWLNPRLYIAGSPFPSSLFSFSSPSCYLQPRLKYLFYHLGTSLPRLRAAPPAGCQHLEAVPPLSETSSCGEPTMSNSIVAFIHHHRPRSNTVHCYPPCDPLESPALGPLGRDRIGERNWTFSPSVGLSCPAPMAGCPTPLENKTAQAPGNSTGCRRCAGAIKKKEKLPGCLRKFGKGARLLYWSEL